MRLGTGTVSMGILAALVLYGAAAAKDYQAGSLKIGQPWSRATPAGAKVAAGYLTIVNTGREADRLTGGTFAEAGRAEVHEMSTENGVMKMRPVPGGGLEIKPGQTVALKPGGYHMMFMDLKSPLKQGERVSGTLVFEKAGPVPVEFEVGALAAREPPP